MNAINWLNTKFSKLFRRSVFQYLVSKGTVNFIPDNPEQQIKDGYKKNISVYGIITRIDNLRKQAKLKLYQRQPDGTKKEITDHDLCRFLRKVNPYTTTNDFITQCLIYILITGEQFTYKLKTETGLNKGLTRELHTLPSPEVEIIEGTWLDPIQGYRVEGNINDEFPADMVTHTKLFNPNWHDDETFHGMSPLVAAAYTVAKLNGADETQLAQINNQSPPYILFAEAPAGSSAGVIQGTTMGVEKRARLIEEIKENSQNSRGMPLVVPQKLGKLDLGTTIADLELSTLTEKGVIALCTAYCLPPELIGYGDKTYNNMGTARKAAYTDCIMPNMNRITELFNESLIAGNKYEEQGYFFGMDYSEIEELQEGFETMVGWMAKAGYSKNEIRERTGGKRIEDRPLMDEPIISAGETFLSDYEVDNDDPEGDKDFSDYLNHSK